MATIEKITLSKKTCFVCDMTLTGKRHQLSSYKLRYSKKEILEKLGSIVGDKYVVICQAGDVICQRCVSVMETLDKVEHEAAAAKRLILRFLDKKYSLDNESNLPMQQETELEATLDDKMAPSVSSFAIRKRKAFEEVEKLTEDVTQASEDPRSRIWLKCDTCHYTTNYTSFVQRHIRGSNCTRCNALLKDGVCTVKCATQRMPTHISEDTPSEKFSEAPILITTFLGNENVTASSETPLEEHLSSQEGEDESDAPTEKRTLYFQVFESNGKVEQASREIFTVANSGDQEMWNEEPDQSAELL